MLSQLSPRLQLCTMYCVTIKIYRLHYSLKTLSAIWMLLAFLDLDMHVKERFVSSRHDFSCLSWLYVQYGTFQQLEWILGKLRDWNCYFVGRYLPRGVFHRKGIEFDNFLRRFHHKQDCPCVKKVEDDFQIKQTKNRWLKLVEMCSLNSFRTTFKTNQSFNIHMEIADEIEVIILSGRYLPRGVF